MRFTVIWKPSALQKLAQIWISAANRDDVSIAVSDIEHHLAHKASAADPFLVGTRLIVKPPLAVVYEVDHGDCKATIVKVVYRP